METHRDEYRLTRIHDVARECPFCGGTTICLVERDFAGVGKRYGVICADCMAGIEPGTITTPWEAIDAWNGGERGRYSDRRDAD